ncbi:MAG: TIGR01777 family protein [Armatimonadetes bacterium]|nr:TIGR01777 family protein [Armatimonadota bacterium]
MLRDTGQALKGRDCLVRQVSSVLISGASGFIGRHVSDHLMGCGLRVGRLVRRAVRAPDEIAWDPSVGDLAPQALSGWDAVVNLSGRGIATRWTPAAKREILDSRIRPTQTLARTIAEAEKGPQVLISASAIGYYGNRGDEELTEESPSGNGFLSQVCRQWEAATEPASQSGTRVVMIRMGMVLSPHGGALARMLPAFKFGIGGPWGAGSQWVSWIAMDDLTRAIEFALSCEGLRGPANAVAPEPVTASQFARILARVLRRPCIARIPGFAMKAAFGEMAQETLLASVRALPAALRGAGFEFAHPTLEGAFSDMLK